MPFAVGGAFGAGDYCLDSGGNGNSTPPCDGPTTGNFGVLSFAHCGVNRGLDDDIAAGADHVYTSNPTGMSLPDIDDDCTQPGPNTVLSDPGNTVGQETPGRCSVWAPVPSPTAAGAPATGAERLQCVLARLGSGELGVRKPRCDRQSPAVGVHPDRTGHRRALDLSPRDVRRAARRHPGAAFNVTSCTPRSRRASPTT